MSRPIKPQPRASREVPEQLVGLASWPAGLRLWVYLPLPVTGAAGRIALEDGKVVYFHRRADRQPANTRIVGGYDQVRFNGVTYHVLHKCVSRNAYGLWQRIYSAEIADHYVGFVTTRPKSNPAIDEAFEAIMNPITFETFNHTSR